MRKTAAGFNVVAAEELPPISLPDPSDNEASTDEDQAELTLPPTVRARYAALLTHGVNSSIKLLRVPEGFDIQDRDVVAARLGIEAVKDFRVAAKLLQPATPRSEALILAVAFPERMASALLSLLPKTGLPAPRFIGLAELAAVNAFLNDPREPALSSAHGFIHFDHDFSIIALFNEGRLSQLRTFPFGMAAVIRRIRRVLNVDETTAAGVLSDGAFDISHLIEEETREVRGQFVISRDFMERSENCSLSALHISGAQALIKPFMRGTQIAKTWAAWDALNAYGLASNGVGAASWSWTACVGSCIGVLMES